VDIQSLQDILYIFLDWHPARITTFTNLVFGVIKSRTVKIKELAMHVKSKGNLHAKINKPSSGQVPRYLLEERQLLF